MTQTALRPEDDFRQLLLPKLPPTLSRNVRPTSTRRGSMSLKARPAVWWLVKAPPRPASKAVPALANWA